MDIKLTILLAFVLIISAAYDIRSHRIPNYLTYSSMFIGILCNTLINGTVGLTFSLFGITSGIGLLIIFYLMGGMGAGDVKLVGAVGSFLGTKGVFISFLISAIVGGLYSLFLILFFRKKFAGVFSNLYYSGIHLIMTRKLLDFGTIHTDNRPRLCYGLAIGVGTGTYLLMKITGVGDFPI
jgi:prepilin peptidase CpaA